MKKSSWVIIIGFFFLSGCIQPSLRTAEDYIGHGWLDVNHEDHVDEPPLYCYQTIGHVDCYKEPMPGRESTLVTEYPIRNKRHYSNWIWPFQPDPTPQKKEAPEVFHTTPVGHHDPHHIQSHALPPQHHPAPHRGHAHHHGKRHHKATHAKGHVHHRHEIPHPSRHHAPLHHPVPATSPHPHDKQPITLH